jgi:hypothetical protein
MSKVRRGIPESIFWGREARAEIDGAAPSGSGLPTPKGLDCRRAEVFIYVHNLFITTLGVFTTLAHLQDRIRK